MSVTVGDWQRLVFSNVFGDVEFLLGRRKTQTLSFDSGVNHACLKLIIDRRVGWHSLFI